MIGSPIVLVNRTSEPLRFVADGQHHVLQPGDNYGFVESQAYFATAQNPVMGSEDYHTLEFTSKVGVKGNELYPCTPIPDEVLIDSLDAAERFDRRGSGLKAKDKVQSRHPAPRGRSAAVTSGANGNAFAIGG